MRSPIWFVVAGVIALASLAGTFFYLMPRITALGSEMVRVVVPGTTVLTLDKPGAYTIYHEKKSMVNGRYYASDTVNGLRLELTAERTGAPVELTEPTGSSSYTIGNRSGSSILVFALDRPGRYRLASHLAGDRSGPEAVLAIEQGTFGALFGAVFGTVALGLGGLGLAGAIVVMVLWQRSKAASKSAPAAGTGGTGR